MTFFVALGALYLAAYLVRDARRGRLWRGIPKAYRAAPGTRYSPEGWTEPR